jgi:MFS family permease
MTGSARTRPHESHHTDCHRTPDDRVVGMKKRVYNNYLLILLLVILAFNYADRQALGLVLQDIKVDLGLSDTQLGFLSGIAFALFYSVMGIPLARWADRGNRVAIISLTATLWSVAVALCGLVSNFVQLLLIRIGVAVGEAGCIPPALSLIADHFTRTERPRAVAIYMMGGSLSVVIGYFLAGWLNEFYGWRMTFILLGLLGLPLSALVWFTLREPRLRGSTEEGVSTFAATPLSQLEAAASSSEQPTLQEVWITLWANRTFRHLLFGFAVWSFFAYGIGQWQPAFFIRSYRLQTGELGTLFALTAGLGSLAGTYLGGALASRYAASNERLQLKGIAILYCGAAVAFSLIFLSPNVYLAFGLMAVSAVVIAASVAPLLATLQTLVAPHMRAMSIALVYLFANFIGMGLGPLAAGALSDALGPLMGEESLRYALIGLCPGYFWGAWHLWQGSKSVTRDLEAVQGDSEHAVLRTTNLARASASPSATS